MSLRTPFHLALPLLVAMAAPLAAQEAPVTRDTVVATVNGEDITLGHMLVVRARLPQQYANLDAATLFDGILDQIIQQTVLGQQAGELSEINELVLQNEERALLSSQVIAEVALAATTDEAIQAAYDEQYAEAGGETEYNASHILVETEEEANDIIAELENGGDFATLAQEKSTGPSGPNGGLLGWFGEGMMVTPFEDAVKLLAAGEVSPPVQTQFGWHVIILNDIRQTAAPELDAVRNEIVDQIQGQAVEDLVATLEADAAITRPEDGAFDPAVINDFSLIEE